MKTKTTAASGSRGLAGGMSAPLRDYYESRRADVRRSIFLYKSMSAGRWARLLRAGRVSKGEAGTFSSVALEPFESYLARGGKNLRSLLTCLVLEAYGRRVRDFLPLVGLMEVLESSTIMIDDFIDNSPFRRGGPSAHRVYGFEKTAVSALSVYYGSWNAFSREALPISRRAEIEAARWLARGHLRTCLGQMAELEFMRRRRPLTLERYADCVRDHIATLSFAGPLRLPALACGAAARELEALESLGESMGLAYHLRGDELNLFPPDGGIGKMRGDDLVGGTMTYLLSEALRRSVPRDRAFLLSVLSDARADPRAIARAIRVIEASGARSLNRRAIERYSREAEAVIAGLPFADRHKRLLCDVLDFMGRARRM